MMNNLSESLAAHSLTLRGRDEIRKRERAESTRGPDIPSQDVFQVCSEVAILKSYCQEEIPDDDIVTAAFQFALNSESMIEEEECAPSAFASDLTASESYTPGEDEDQEVPRMQAFNEYLAGFATMAEEQRLSCDPYQALYEHAERRISELAVKVGVDPVRIRTIFSVWLFAPIQDVPFL
jgi:hypothetical protein